jgi:TonB-dependent starch-binding outer membrane protein SusC
MQNFQHGKVAVLNGTEPKLSLLSRAQIVRIVKCCTFILLAGCLHLYATGYPQNRITLSASNAPLAKVFREIQKQTGYHFLYINQQLNDAKPVTLKVKDASLTEVLDACFKEQPFGYEVKENTIIIKQKVREQKSSVSMAPAPGEGDPTDVTGRVTDEKGNPLVGANVKIRGTNTGTVTDANGRFILKNVDANAQLEISFVGHEIQTITVSGKKIFAIVLSRRQSILDETQVIAYGTTTRRFATSNIGTVKAKDIENQPVQNPLLALQGRVPGIEVTQLSGLPGGGVKIRIQGINTLRFNDANSPTDPLIVIDGVPYPSTLTPIGTIIGNFMTNNESLIQGGNPLNYINPADIESIDVLKDADATAIYGSRAANGAILITTKKGKPGNSKLSVNVQHGWGKVTRHVDMMNTRQYLDMRYEAFSNDGKVPTSNPNPPTGSNQLYAPDLTIWDTTRYTDWQKELIGGTAQYTNINASLSGGTAGTQYLVGGTFNRQTSVFPGDFDDKKGSLHFNLNSASFNQKLRLQLSGSYMIDNNHLSGFDLTQQALFTEPNAPTLYNADGTLNWAPNAAGTSTWTNPLDYLLSSDFKNTTKNLVTNATLSYKILKGLEIASNFGYTDLRSTLYMPGRLESNPPEKRATSQRASSFGNRTMNSWIIEPQLSYRTLIGKGKLEGLAGSTIQKNNTDMMAIAGGGFTNDLLMKNLSNATTVTLQGSSSSEYRYNALFGRLNYNWDDKYIINLTARRDGSSRFGDKNKFHNFWSAGIGWLFSNEKWLKDHVSFLSFGKLRGSFGTTGNDQITDYSNLSLYSSLSGLLPYQNLISMSPTRLPNPYLEWEETRKLQGGIDLGFFKDRIIINATYVFNRSSNQLIQYKLPSIAGFTTITKNFPATIQNTSWELVLNTTNLKGKQISWTTSVNLTIPRNKLVSFPGIENTSYGSSTSTVIVGKPLGLTRVYPFAGVDPATGLYMAYKYDGTVTSSPSPTTDRTVLIYPASRFYGGIQNSISYKGFQLDFLFQFVRQLGQKQLYYSGGRLPGSFSSGATNQPVTVLNHWRKPGDISEIGRYGLALSNSAIAGSDALYSYDASYIRLKNVALSWQLPAAWLHRVKMQSARFYFRGQNLATITKYSGLDPESQSSTSLPPLQVWTIGTQIEL